MRLRLNLIVAVYLQLYFEFFNGASGVPLRLGSSAALTFVLNIVL